MYKLYFTNVPVFGSLYSNCLKFSTTKFFVLLFSSIAMLFSNFLLFVNKISSFCVILDVAFFIWNPVPGPPSIRREAPASLGFNSIITYFPSFTILVLSGRVFEYTFSTFRPATVKVFLVNWEFTTFSLNSTIICVTCCPVPNTSVTDVTFLIPLGYFIFSILNVVVSAEKLTIDNNIPNIVKNNNILFIDTLLFCFLLFYAA